MHLELQAAHGVRDALDAVLQPMRPVVHGVDAPGVAGAVVFGVADAVHQRVAQQHVGAGHVDLGAQHLGAARKLARAHAAEEVQVLLGRAIAPGARRARLGHGAPVQADLLLGLVVHVGLAGADELLGVTVHLLEVVGGVVETVVPVVAQPADVLLDGEDEALLFLLGVGVVEAEVAEPAELLGHAEVQPEGLGVADVQPAVGLGREAGVHLAAPAAGPQVLANDLPDEVGRRGLVVDRAHAALLGGARFQWRVAGRRYASRPGRAWQGPPRAKPPGA